MASDEPAGGVSVRTEADVGGYYVGQTQCRCHPETCCCPPWAVYGADHFTHSKHHEQHVAELVANALNAKAPNGAKS